MSDISTKLINKAVYKLCYDANICLNNEVYSKLFNAYNNADRIETKNILKFILQNAKIAYEKKRPLCQDTGQVIVFVEIGQNVKLTGNYIEDEINSAVEKCYKENFFRKSVVINSVFNRENTKSNTPVIIYTKIITGDEIKLSVLIKGAGSENKTKLEMMLPTSTEEEIIKCCGNLILSAGENSCPPMFIGIGIGGTADKASIMSKQALIKNEFSENEIIFANKIKDYINSKAPIKYDNSYVLDVKVMTSPTHIACMPVCVTINCHSERMAGCIIKNGEIEYIKKVPQFIDLEINNIEKEVNADDIESIKHLKQGEEFLLTGEIYVARDMAHKRLNEMILNEKQLPFDLKNKIIFYAGPCPNKPNEVIGSIGPTTASRMDKYAVAFYNKGMLASIGKGSRSKEVETAIKKNGAKYFTVTGGIAALLADKVKKAEIIAFEDLGAEAVYKLRVEKFPLRVELG